MAKSRSDDGVRLRVPDRSQMVMSMQCPDELVDADHPVRVVWRVVCALDLGRFYEVSKKDKAEGKLREPRGARSTRRSA